MGNRTHEPPPLRTAKETNQEANHMSLGLSDNLFNKGILNDVLNVLYFVSGGSIV
jgi:hypothetical protein